jgi:hypothetical protein
VYTIRYTPIYHIQRYQYVEGISKMSKNKSTENKPNENIQLGREVQQGTAKKLPTQIDLTTLEPTWVGNFIFRYPSLMDRMKIGVMKTSLLNGMSLAGIDNEVDNIAYMMATLTVVMESAPDWFQLDVLEDYDALDRVFEEYAKWRDSFRSQTNA